MSTSSTIVNGKKDATTQSDRGTFGRYVETPVDRMSPEMLDAFEFTKKPRGEVPGPLLRLARALLGDAGIGALRARKGLIQRSLNTGRTNEEPSVFAGFASQGIHETF